MISDWKTFLLESAGGWQLPKDRDWNFLFHNNSQPHGSNINLLWFHGTDEFPTVVTKLYRSPTILTREFEGLQRVHRVAAELVPKPFHFGEIGNFWTLWMQGLPGQRMPLSEGVPEGVLQSAFESIRQIHAALRTRVSVFGEARYRRMVVEPLQTVAHYNDIPSVLKGCKLLEKQITREWIESLPVIPQHGDYYYGNVVTSGKRWYILDWETFGQIDLPLYDILTFGLSALLAAESNTGGWPIARRNEMGTLVKEYCDSLALTEDDARLLLPLTLANWFHIQWTDGRQDFCESMYKTITRYFESPEEWESFTRRPNS